MPDTTLSNQLSVIIRNFQELPIEAIAGGAIRGANLFHSFQEFNVSADAIIKIFSKRLRGFVQSKVLLISGQDNLIVQADLLKLTQKHAKA